jgi:uncharacterized LabA/DUF88 family protein
LLFKGLTVDLWAYVDGFNLYNGALKNTTYRWLNLHTFAEKLCLGHSGTKVKFFTAQVNRRFDDPQQPVRQRLYWRALRTLSAVEIIEGHFKTRTPRLPEESSVVFIEAELQAGRSIAGLSPTFVQVRRSEEKGTDVNIATHMVHDGHVARFDAAILVSNDSDLAEAVRIVYKELGRPVHIFRPQAIRPNAKLQSVATTFNNIDVRHLASSQLPPTLTDSRGSFSKPPNW